MQNSNENLEDFSQLDSDFDEATHAQKKILLSISEEDRHFAFDVMQSIDDANLTLELVKQKMSDARDDWFDQNTEELDPFTIKVLSFFPESQRAIAAVFLEKIPPETLTIKSAEEVAEEIREFGGVGSNLMNVAHQNNDLRNSLKFHRKLVLILGGVIFVLGIILFAMVYLFSVYPKYRTIQTVDNSVICEIDPLNNPEYSVSSIEDFAKKAILATYSFDYINWQNQINEATDRFFIPEGRSSFKSALKNSPSLRHIITNNLLMKSTAISAPQLTDRKIEPNGQPSWIVKMPISVEFYANKSKPDDVQRLIAEVKIKTTIRDAKNPKGIGVASIILKPYR
ncbi:TPA: DotI/IcmL family type IV secretion protein [Acinetobacter baumannii]|uniref:DotI/IcmL family type IV secretion protein n=1 Tax=Acinetobacter baumannii TaxID=470 RepID=UPI00224D2328|nr:DotI/IcmL family type IV secretion protein [Acinetobacter baumannii]MCX3034034.1 DotI/IcmL family type IV secretion protein [Acinetobacter baumannii]